MFFRRRLLICLVLCGLLISGGAWKLRHRIREILRARTEQTDPPSLEVVSRAGFQPSFPANPVQVTSQDWPGWRGYSGNNHSADTDAPLAWSESENIVWKTAIPGRGHSSPCVAGPGIYLTTALEDRKLQQVICLDFADGHIRWTRDVHQGEFLYSNPKNSHASSTPVTDGHDVFVVFPVNGAVWLSCLSDSGEIRWQCECGPYVSKEGFGASPVLVDDSVIVAADCVEQSWIAAVHRSDGSLVWRKARGRGTSYGSPALVEDEGRRFLAMAGLDRVVAVDPTNGTELWSIAGPDMSASTPVSSDGMLFVTGCTPASGISGIQLGKVPSVKWNHSVKVEVPSPLAADGLAWFVQDSGILMCCEAETGTLLYRQRLNSSVSSSPVMSGSHILIAMENGRTIVLKNGREWEKVSENILECSGIYATPAVVRGRIILRTVEHLYAIGQDTGVLSHQN